MSVWFGPLESDWADVYRVSLRAQVPPQRWPYGPPDHHETNCLLHVGGLYCDCAASAADDERWGAGGWPTALTAGWSP